MIAKKSDLILERFVVIESRFSMIITEDSTDLKPDDILNTYPVDIDFSLEQDNNVELYRIVTEIEINNCENKKSGYSIAVTGLGFFKFSPDTKLNEDQKIQMLQTSALSICITNLRSFIANQTSYLPWGSYTFHAVDIQALLEEKQKGETEI
jgi:hypothetical protein